MILHLKSSAQVASNMQNLKTYYTAYSLPLQFSSVQSLRRVQLFATPWIAACQEFTVHHQLPEFTSVHHQTVHHSRSSLKLMPIESAMPSSHLICCRPLFLLPPIPPSIRVSSNESALRMRWPKYWITSSLAQDSSIDWILTLQTWIFLSFHWDNFTVAKVAKHELQIAEVWRLPSLGKWFKEKHPSFLNSFPL